MQQILVLAQSLTQSLMTIWIQSDSKGRPILIGCHDAIISDRPSAGSANPAAPYLHGLCSICARRYLFNRCNLMQ